MLCIPLLPKLARATILMAFTILSIAPRSFAQSPSVPQSTPATSDSDSTASTDNTNSALLKELDAMKHRIEELEAQLRTRAAATSTPDQINSPNPAPNKAMASPTTTAVSPAASPPPADTPTAKAAPMLLLTSRGSMEILAPRSLHLIPISSRLKYAQTSTTLMTFAIRKTTPSVDRAKFSGPMKSN